MAGSRSSADRVGQRVSIKIRNRGDECEKAKRCFSVFDVGVCYLHNTNQYKRPLRALVDHYCHIELMDRSFDYSRANKGTHCGVP